jgi:hypothetical protein
MACTGARPFVFDRCLGIIRRGSCESDFFSLCGNQHHTICNVSNENSYPIGDKSEPAYVNTSFFSYAATNANGSLGSNDA